MGDLQSAHAGRSYVTRATHFCGAVAVADVVAVAILGLPFLERSTEVAYLRWMLGVHGALMAVAAATLRGRSPRVS